MKTSEPLTSTFRADTDEISGKFLDFVRICGENLPAIKMMTDKALRSSIDRARKKFSL